MVNLPFTQPAAVVPYDVVRKVVLRYKVFQINQNLSLPEQKIAFNQELDRAMSYWTMAQIAKGLNVRGLIRAVKRSNHP